jgi:hypothetical protein
MRIKKFAALNEDQQEDAIRHIVYYASKKNWPRYKWTEGIEVKEAISYGYNPDIDFTFYENHYEDVITVFSIHRSIKFSEVPGGLREEVMQRILCIDQRFHIPLGRWRDIEDLELYMEAGKSIDKFFSFFVDSDESIYVDFKQFFPL